jgi:alkylhydroperoxidase family enzyme
MTAHTPLWQPLDRVSAWLAAPVRARTAPLPGPLGMPAYARLARSRVPIEPLPPRLHHLVAQLAALRSGCEYCAQHNRHTALKAGVPREAIDTVGRYASTTGFTEAERAALALAEAVTGFAEAEGGFSMEVLVWARCHFGEGQIIALVAAVATEHFFDPATGRMGRDCEVTGAGP